MDGPFIIIYALGFFICSSLRYVSHSSAAGVNMYFTFRALMRTLLYYFNPHSQFSKGVCVVVIISIFFFVFFKRPRLQKTPQAIQARSSRNKTLEKRALATIRKRTKLDPSGTFWKKFHWKGSLPLHDFMGPDRIDALWIGLIGLDGRKGGMKDA